MVRAKKIEEETEIHMTEMKQFSVKMQQASSHHERTLLRKYRRSCCVQTPVLSVFYSRSMITWQIYIRNERIAKNLKYEQETTKRKIDSFLDAASTGKLWGAEGQTASETATPTTAMARPQSRPRTVSVVPRATSFTSRPRSAIVPGEKTSATSRTQSDVKLDDFFRASSTRDDHDGPQKA